MIELLVVAAMWLNGLFIIHTKGLSRYAPLCFLTFFIRRLKPLHIVFSQHNPTATIEDFKCHADYQLRECESC